MRTCTEESSRTYRRQTSFLLLSVTLNFDWLMFVTDSE